MVRIRDPPGALGTILEGLRNDVNLIGSIGYSTPDCSAIRSGFVEPLSASDDAPEGGGSQQSCRWSRLPPSVQARTACRFKGDPVCSFRLVQSPSVRTG